MWHQFHFGGAASYRYFLHNRKCRPERKEEKKKGDEELADEGGREFWRNRHLHSKMQMKITCSTKETPTLCLSGWDEISPGSVVIKIKPPAQTKLLGICVLFFTSYQVVLMGFPGGSDGNRICVQCRKPGFNPGGEDPLEKGMATHSIILAWRIPWTEEPGKLQSTGLQRVGHNWAQQHLAIIPFYSLPRSQLFHLWNGNCQT